MEEIQLNGSPSPVESPKKQGKTLAIIIISVIAFSALVVALLFLVIPSDKSNNYLTMENFNRIETGMSYNQVVEIFDGNQGELQSSSSYEDITMSIYIWTNESGSRIVSIMFENGAVTTKSQVGLK